MEPRTKITSVPYAYRSAESDTADYAYEVLGESAGGWTDDGMRVRLTNINDSVGIGTSAPESKLHVWTAATEAKLGESTRAVYGEHPMSGSYGSLGQLNIGAAGYSSDLYGVYGSTFNGYGVYGSTSDNFGQGVRGQNIDGSYGYLGGKLMGVYGESGGFAGYFSGDLYASNGGFGVSPETKLHVSGGNWNLSANEGDFKIGNFTHRIKMGIATEGGGAGDARIRAQGGTNRLALGTGTDDVLTLKGTDVGVGTNDPAVKLDIRGMARVGSGTWPTSGEGMELGYVSAWHRGYIQVYDREGGGWGDLYLGDGNVGIGVESPQDKLQISGNLRLDSGAGGGNFIRFVNDGVFKWALLHKPWATTTFQIYDEVGGQTVMSFEENTGYVGVNTSDPSSELDISGDLRVTGAFTGDNGPNNGAPFPRPAYDTGWLSPAPGQTVVMTHNIGVDVNKYFVDLQFQESGGLGIHQYKYGVDRYVGVGDDTYRQGAYWHNLTTTTISITRETDDTHSDQVRVRIWFIE
jgi:hypothetical protein